jgi:hypothetical protein
VFAEFAVRPADDATAHAILQNPTPRTIATPPARLYT